ncbi:MAG: pyruvate, phosphate dikinase [Alphaproteobacteria bacterium]|nr:pyruvate, phosphate dikinase [Alphaproteobacteria bacterium]
MSASTPKMVYKFGNNTADGSKELTQLLGGKGANLAEMAQLGLPVPPGFTITTDTCKQYLKSRSMPPNLKEQVQDALHTLQKQTSAELGNPETPLLVSVRSGAPASMPGMMDTVLNLGLNAQTVQGLARQTQNRRFAYDSWRRFIQMFANIVLELSHGDFEDILEDLKKQEDIRTDSELGADALERLVQQYRQHLDRAKVAVPDDPHEQLWQTIAAVFQSWENERARTYRRLHNIPDDWGTAVTVQAMVFGNLGDDCATGVAFTRDPATGENRLYGEYLVNAQGEDVVAGIRTPHPLTENARAELGADEPAMETLMPETFAELARVRGILEKHYRDMQDIEFTVQNGVLYMLQTRAGKRSVNAATRIACEMVAEGLVSTAEALMRVEPESLRQILHPTLADDADSPELGRGLPASPGAASGVAVFSASAAEKYADEDDVILCRNETSPEDIQGMYVARGILTTRGGMTSHAAVVARGMGRPCVVGAGSLVIDEVSERLVAHEGTPREVVVTQGQRITIDGGGGRIFSGAAKMVEPSLDANFESLMTWADEHRRLGIRVNADTPEDCRTAIRFGAEGIGLCRTEHMFFHPSRMLAMREMIVAATSEGRRAALAKLQPVQRGDFAEIFRIMDGRPVTIRLLDPPLHEFLPRSDEEQLQLAESLGISAERLRERLRRLTEVNPMLGHRGCRLAMTYPEIYEMQLRAIFEAAREVRGGGVEVAPEVMVPLVSFAGELRRVREMVEAVAREVAPDVRYLVGTMIELPRAALRAGELARLGDFFSFGTNDLTQTALGLSRDDAGAFLPGYETAGVIERDPFTTLDSVGVGELVRLGVERGRAANPDLKIGICGEHGGDPASIEFFAGLGLDYVSCSPFRLPIARLSSGRASVIN